MFLVAIFFSAVFFAYAAFPGACDSLLERHYQRLLVGLVVGLGGVLLLFAGYRHFNNDEFQFIHSVWYVAQGFRPYADFFSIMHPLLYYLAVPVLVLFGYTTAAVVALRIFIFCQTACVLGVVYLIAGKVTPSRESRLLSMVALMSFSIFLRKASEFRPDVPMVLCWLIAVYCLLTFLRTSQKRYLAACGLSEAIALLFSNKAVLSLAVLAIVLGWLLVRRKIKPAPLLYFIVAFALPVLAFLLHLVATGAFDDYILTNWRYHLEYNFLHSPFIPLGSLAGEHGSLPKSAPFWMLSIVAPIVILIKRDTSVEAKVVALAGLLLLALPFTTTRTGARMFLPAIVLQSISIGHFLTICFERLGWRPLYRLALIGTVLVVPMLLTEGTDFRSNREQLATIDFVLKNSDESDRVYDSYGVYNVFRPDLHYVWYLCERLEAIEWLNQERKVKYEDYDIYQLIKTKRPKFISTWRVNVHMPGIVENYFEVRPGVYMRREL